MLSCAILCWWVASPSVLADEPPAPADHQRDVAIERDVQLAQGPAEPAPSTTGTQTTTARPLTADEIVQAIKLRAQRALARKRARKWSWDNFATWTFGDETNPYAQKARKSAVYMEEYLSTTFGYRFTPQWTWNIGYSLDALNYNEATDLSTLTNSLTTKLIYRPWKTIRLEAHYTFDDSDYPYDDGASTWDQKVHVRLRHSFWKQFYHWVGWTYTDKQYKDKLKRESTSTRIPTKYREDFRHTGIYEIGWLGEQNTLKLKQEFYFNDSNEGHQDFNDAQDYKVKLSGSHEWTEQWSSTAGYTYEIKRFESRSVTNRAGGAVSERDNAHTYDAGLTYKIDKNKDVTYAWKYKHQHSNDPAQTYGDVTHTLAFNVSF